ncbi:flagellar basal-body rod protein FlgC [Rhodanobacter sp. FW510-R12]|uniref:flagellar basal body rod protein FlgC n=1 Tax=unclassified Rhodanobacter TaxID=2621553 RepID=UPI0007A9A329|nr:MULTISPECIES: flagellar basal body rod protein FlgC [unclassified Rhodanobacter]KZC18151.1 flagellar basal-body rod protein FlgC [Rhodanobacter sp. FW104-R8]KZC25779.1 flagellar basal-body rod protein FlgC [Rhodanobacter sp. FW510-T8]KZC33542.1 flagellar basal-body rod protein FlgC [Rhodanobacter sp. FW510-R10]
MSLFSVFNVAGSGMAAQSLRLNTVASNLANADSVAGTPEAAYRAREPLFSAVQNRLAGGGDAPGEGVQVLGVTESQAAIPSRYEPGNPLADADGYVYSSNVNPVDELVNMISASRSYQNNVEVMNSTRQLMQKTLDLGK